MSRRGLDKHPPQRVFHAARNNASKHWESALNGDGSGKEGKVRMRSALDVIICISSAARQHLWFV